MREIKFRAWDKVEKRFVILDEMRFISHGDLISCTTRMYGTKMDKSLADIELMQFTGLKDKNGKEIYEGDIVKYSDRIWEVFWHQGTYGTWSMKIQCVVGWEINGLPDHDNIVNKCEVIGNIYENPELLNDRTR